MSTDLLRLPAERLQQLRNIAHERGVDLVTVVEACIQRHIEDGVISADLPGYSVTLNPLVTITTPKFKLADLTRREARVIAFFIDQSATLAGGYRHVMPDGTIFSIWRRGAGVILAHYPNELLEMPNGSVEAPFGKTAVSLSVAVDLAKMIERHVPSN